MNIKLLLVLIGAIFLRFFFLSEIPFRLDGDTSKFALESLAVWHDKAPLFSTGWYGYTNVLFYINGFFLKLFTNPLLGSRIFSAIGGIMSILATYFLAKTFFNKKIALISSFLLTFLPFHLEYSRNGTDIIHTAWLLPINLYFLYLGIKKNHLFLILAGFLLGFSQYFYVSVRLIILIELVLLFLITWKYRWKKIVIYFATLLVVALLVYSPMIDYYNKHPEKFFERIKQVGILQNGWLQKKVNSKPNSEIFKKQVLNPFLVFFKDVDPQIIQYFSKRYLNSIESLIFALGLLICLKKGRQTSYFIILFWIVSGIILGGILTESSPQAPRYVIIIPAVVVCMAIAIEWLLTLRKGSLKYLIIIILLSNSVWDIYLYWRYENHDVFQYDTNGQIASYAGRYLMTRHGNYSIYFLGNNNMYYNAVPSLRFLTKRSGEDIVGNIEKNIDRFGKNSVFIILSDREKDLKSLKAFYPDRKLSTFHNPLGQFLFWVYEL